MAARTFREHLAHLESSKAWKVGDRVKVTISGRTGTLVKEPTRHVGWTVRWDEPVFGCVEGKVYASGLERI